MGKTENLVGRINKQTQKLQIKRLNKTIFAAKKFEKARRAFSAYWILAEFVLYENFTKTF